MIKEKKQLSGHILFDYSVDSPQAIRRYPHIDQTTNVIPSLIFPLFASHIISVMTLILKHNLLLQIKVWVL